MVQPDQTRDPVARLAAELNRLRQRVKAMEDGGLKVPILDEDPSADDPTNLWLFNDGRLRGRDASGNIREWVPTAPGSSTSGTPKPPTLTPHLHATTYAATDAAAFCPEHGVELELNFGFLSPAHNERLVMVIFDDATIRADLAGATIHGIEISARTLDSYLVDGVEIAWGGHNESALPGAYSQQYEDVWRDTWPRIGGEEYREMPRWFGRALRDDDIRGLVINQPSTAQSYAGRLDPAVSLRITYSHAH
jgi:hypothetical protein